MGLYPEADEQWSLADTDMRPAVGHTLRTRSRAAGKKAGLDMRHTTADRTRTVSAIAGTPIRRQSDVAVSRPDYRRPGHDLLAEHIEP